MNDALRAVAYVSSARVPLTDHVIETLLFDSRDFNFRSRVTGALLLHDITFFQYFEGPPHGVAEVYERIKRSHVHHRIIELLYGEVDARHFSDWLMGFADAPDSIVLKLEQARWIRTATTISGGPLGVDLLIDFWRTARRIR